MTIDYEDVAEAGEFRALRLWRDNEYGEWVVNGERLNGTIGTQEWSYTSLEAALADVPLLHALLVSGVTMTTLEGAWHVNIPIVGGGLEGSVWPNRADAERFLRRWVK